MPSGITKQDVWETARALVREDDIPTVINVRSRLGGGNPHTIAAHLASWRERHMEEKLLFCTEREILVAAREEMECERIDLMEEIERLDGEIEAARKALSTSTHALDVERRAAERAKTESRTQNELQRQQLEEVRANARKFAEQNRVLQTEITTLRGQATRAEELKTQVGELRAELAGLAGAPKAEEAGRGEVKKLAEQNQAFRVEIAALREKTIRTEELKGQVEKLQAELVRLAASASAPRGEAGKAGRAETEKLAEQNQALRIEVATLEERASQAEVLKPLVEKLQTELAGLVKSREAERAGTEALKTQIERLQAELASLARAGEKHAEPKEPGARGDRTPTAQKKNGASGAPETRFPVAARHPGTIEDNREVAPRTADIPGYRFFLDQLASVKSILIYQADRALGACWTYGNRSGEEAGNRGHFSAELEDNRERFDGNSRETWTNLPLSEPIPPKSDRLPDRLDWPGSLLLRYLRTPSAFWFAPMDINNFAPGNYWFFNAGILNETIERPRGASRAAASLGWDRFPGTRALRYAGPVRQTSETLFLRYVDHLEGLALRSLSVLETYSNACFETENQALLGWSELLESEVTRD